MLFAFCTDRGSPGSTIAALVMAAARGLPAVVVEADPYGGDLALRLRPNGQPLPSTPTVLSVSAGRSGQQPTEARPNSAAGRRHQDLWRDGAHQLTDLVRVVPGFLAAEHGKSMAWPVLASALESQSVPIFADLGRIHTGSPSLPIAAAADALITVCRGDMASVHHMVDRLELLVPAIAERNGRPPMVLPVVVAPRQHGSKIADSIAEILRETAVGPTLRGVSWLAWDPAAVTLLESGSDPWAKPLKKSPLMKSAQQAMSMLGLATGLEHSDPSASKRQSNTPGARRSTTQQAPTSDAGHPWSKRGQETPQPARQATGGWANTTQDSRPTPPPAWSPGHDEGKQAHPTQPRNGSHVAVPPDAPQMTYDDRVTSSDPGPSRETSGREERH